MKLIRWSPSYDLLNVHSELDRVFGELMDGRPFNPRLSQGDGAPAFLPVDIRRDGDSFIVEASVPGYAPDEVQVTVEDGTLTISAGNDEEGAPGGDYIRRERYVGRYLRQVALGKHIDGDRAQATFNNGVLTVTIPSLTKPEPRRIPVKAVTGK